ncbi:HlyD family secretion protein [Reinekea forsetii]|nr:HlyD family secretion protein [Reinekea forsetii]
MTTSVAKQEQDENQESRHGLFRKQAVEKQQNRLLGDVLVIPPISYSLVTAIIVLLVIAAIVLLFNGTYARKETVQGFLVPDTGVIKVYASTNGIVKDLLVNEGDLVVKNQPLMIINGDRILESGEHLESLMLLEYQEQQNILTNQLNRLPTYFSGKELELTQSIESAKTDIQHIEKQMAYSAEQIQLANTQFSANSASL